MVNHTFGLTAGGDMVLRESESKRRLMDVGAQIIAESGSDSLHIRSLVERADVGVPTFYYHFRTRRQLIAEVQARTYLTIVESLSDCVLRAEAAIKTGNRDDYLQAVGDKMVQIWIATQTDGSWRMVELLRDIWKDHETRRSFSNGVETQIDRWAAIVSRGQELDWVTTDVDARSLVVYCWSASLGRMIFSESRYSSIDEGDIRRIFLFLIGADQRSVD